MSTVWQVLLICACVAIVVGVIASRIVARKKGKPTCDCGCEGCSACKYCKEAQEKKDAQK